MHTNEHGAPAAGRSFAQSASEDTLKDTIRVQRRGAPHGDGQPPVENGGADFQMRIERFPRDEQSHDFARTLENGIDAAIANDAFHRIRRLAALAQRSRRLVTTSTANLHRVIGDPPGPLGCQHLADR
jgi:hypothetical protein